MVDLKKLSQQLGYALGIVICLSLGVCILAVCARFIVWVLTY